MYFKLHLICSYHVPKCNFEFFTYMSSFNFSWDRYQYCIHLTNKKTNAQSAWSRTLLMVRIYWNLVEPQFRSVQFSRSVVFYFLRPHELQHTRPSFPSPTPGVHSNSCPSSRWCHPAILSSVIPFSSCPQSFPASVFSSESTLHMSWSKYWSFSFRIIPSKEHPGLISFRLDWLDLLEVQGTNTT